MTGAHPDRAAARRGCSGAPATGSRLSSANSCRRPPATSAGTKPSRTRRTAAHRAARRRLAAAGSSARPAEHVRQPGPHAISHRTRSSATAARRAQEAVMPHLRETPTAARAASTVAGTPCVQRHLPSALRSHLPICERHPAVVARHDPMVADRHPEHVIAAGSRSSSRRDRLGSCCVRLVARTIISGVFVLLTRRCIGRANEAIQRTGSVGR